jgi:L-aspartate oxidase
MATGGIGQLFEHTTNTRFSNGDGIYFAQKLGATIRDLAFVQFHPTGLYTSDGQDFLISEALRGAGARILNHDFIPFMLSYDQRGDLAPRDIVSRAIWQEMKLANQPFVYLDATHIPVEQLNHHFSHLIEGCLKRTGIDLRQNPIPVMPMQHYSCGGIWTDEFGASSLDNLYAIGECASTGLHGANRLASNSLLEGICMADFATNHSLLLNDDSNFTLSQSTIDIPKVYDLDHKQIKKIFSRAAGVVRKKSSLQEAYDELEHIKASAKETAFSIQAFENTVALTLSILLLKDALSKEVSIGVHYIEQSS